MSTQLQSGLARSLETGDWQERLDAIYATMREMSMQTDPQAMVEAYSRRMAAMFPTNRRISISRRGLSEPRYRITRYSEWDEKPNPWQEPDRLPLLKGGLLADLIYSDHPHIIDQLDIADDDPAAPYLEGQQSLIAIPLLDQGQALNMVVLTREEPAAFDRNRLPEQFWLANLFGRATHNLVLSQQLQEAYSQIDRELKVVADIQQALLPREMPEIPGLDLAAYYRTSRHAGGDYYDFFPLPDGKWGLLIADVSGHGAPSAVVMAITHSIAHLYPSQKDPPGKLLSFVNQHLTERYTGSLGAFVTAFYAVYDPATRELTYSSAGHNPPRVTRACQRSVEVLDRARKVPLGFMEDVEYPSATTRLEPGDRLILYTDGITEATSPDGELFGVRRLDGVLQQCYAKTADDLLGSLVRGLKGWTGDAPPSDDRTVVLATVHGQ
ncbi:PP2C family protein-serine/threonine phosphatase [Maioricimonas sp. JC845]|uniref:PP2C family protein-serine/threonine phosphatase n=1 Tax=Maioricimonas sp. JC845 TaxID=3232138 RepID=UPI00345A2B0F